MKRSYCPCCGRLSLELYHTVFRPVSEPVCFQCWSWAVSVVLGGVA